jgi:hypothetical protein
MRSNSPKFSRRITDVLDEIIPTMPVDDGMSALIARVRQCILKAAAEEQASYEHDLEREIGASTSFT